MGWQAVGLPLEVTHDPPAKFLCHTGQVTMLNLSILPCGLITLTSSSKTHRSLNFKQMPKITHLRGS